MAENKFPDIKSRLQQLKGSDSAEVAEANEEEIRQLEEYAGGSLPHVYREFLRQVGRSTGCLFRGSEGSLQSRFQLRMRAQAEGLLKRTHAAWTLPGDAFVFLMTQGYQFSYFRLSEGDDPPVYHYLEESEGATRLADHLSDYFRRCLEACEQGAARSSLANTLDPSLGAKTEV